MGRVGWEWGWLETAQSATSFYTACKPLHSYTVGTTSAPLQKTHQYFGTSKYYMIFKFSVHNYSFVGIQPPLLVS